MRHSLLNPLFVVAALLTATGASAAPLGLPISLPAPVGAVVDSVVTTAAPYIGDMPNLRPIRGPGSAPSEGSLPGLEQTVESIRPIRGPGSAAK